RAVACECRRFFFFFQAEDGIRDRNVTGVQTCALPIYLRLGLALGQRGGDVKILLPGHIALAHLEQTWGQTGRAAETMSVAARIKIGRASCRERGWASEGAE